MKNSRQRSIVKDEV